MQVWKKGHLGSNCCCYHTITSLPATVFCFDELSNYQYFLIFQSEELILQRNDHWSCSIKKGIIKNSQNLQKSTCVRIYFQERERLRRKCFLKNFAKFLRIYFFTQLQVTAYVFKRIPLSNCNISSIYSSKSSTSKTTIHNKV